MVVRNPTKWRPPSGKGYIVSTGTNYLVTNLSEFLVTNAGDNLVTTPDYAVPKYPTLWTLSGA